MPVISLQQPVNQPMKPATTALGIFHFRAVPADKPAEPLHRLIRRDFSRLLATFDSFKAVSLLE
jgi:hypothetical protein